MSKHICPNCKTEFKYSIFVAKAILGIAGLYLGRKQPIHAIALSGAGTAIGHMIDGYIEKHIERTCPDCGVALLLIAHEAESQFLSAP